MDSNGFKRWYRATKRVSLRFISESTAVSGSEYGFMLALIIIFAIGAISLFGEAARNIHGEITTTLNTSVANHL